MQEKGSKKHTTSTYHVEISHHNNQIDKYQLDLGWGGSVFDRHHQRTRRTPSMVGKPTHLLFVLLFLLLFLGELLFSNYNKECT